MANVQHALHLDVGDTDPSVTICRSSQTGNLFAAINVTAGTTIYSDTEPTSIEDFACTLEAWASKVRRSAAARAKEDAEAAQEATDG